MQVVRKQVAFPQAMPSSPDEFYRELTARNRHFISPETQRRLRTLKLLIAGCGSTGGACIESLARLGCTRFVLADSGAYELNNLNRQHAFLDDLGKNKALFHAEQLKRINPFIEPEVHPRGVTRENVRELATRADLIMDAVDVTTPSGIDMKLALHESAHAARKPVLTALDIGFCQWGESFDYRDSSLEVYRGRLAQARTARHPMKALFSLVPLGAVPAHALELVRDLLVDAEVPASQLGGTSDLLSAVIVSAVTRFVETGDLVPGWEINLEYLALPLVRRVQLLLRAPQLRREIRRLLASVE